MTREEAKEFLEKVADDLGCIGMEEEYTRGDGGKMLEAIKVLEQAPKMGHWSHDGSHWVNRWICSECSYKLIDKQTRFCPNCGANMEGEE